MQFLRELWLRLRWLTSRTRFYGELADEMQFHVESRAEELERSGIPPVEAMSRARREFGSRLKTAEDTSGAWELRWAEDLFSDLCYAGRAFRRNPGFALTAIVCLALGIGANTSIFNITSSFLFSQPSCRESASMIAIWEGGNSDSSIADYKFLRDAHIFDGMAGINVERELNWRDGDRTSRFYAGVVTDDRVQFYARMPKGMTIPIARGHLQSVFEQLDRIHPGEGYKRSNQVRVTGVTGFDVLNQMIPGQMTAFFAMLMIVAGLVLLIACTNVASLLLARATSRSHELAIRLSLGASRRRIVRHLLAESLLLSALGLAAGLLIDAGCAKAINNLTLPVPVPMHPVISSDWRLFWYSLSMVFVSAVLCGLLPALKAVRRDVNPALKEEGRQTTTRTWNLRSVLVAGQLAISIVLLAAGFLFLHNLLRATSMNPGFNVHQTIWAYMRLVPDKYKDTDQTRQMSLVAAALDRLRGLPGVESAAIAREVPLNGNCVIGTHLRTDVSSALVPLEYECNNVGPDYFRTIGIPMLRGREFTAADRKGSQSVAIVNETFAHFVFGNANPVGHTILSDSTNAKSKLIVGVVKDSKYFTLGEKQRLAVYEPYFADEEPVNLHFLIRTGGVPANYVKPINETLGRLDSTAAIETKPMSQALGLALLPSQAGALMLGAMGTLGLMLAAIGLYGVLLYSVSRRTREIGLRVALGATPFEVLALIARHSLILVGSGMTVGLVIAIFAMQPLAMFLVPGLGSVDSSALLGVIGVLGTVALLATLTPAIRAMRIDPVTALRWE